MRTRLLTTWTRLHSTFWFVPSLMAFGALVLSFSMIAIDESGGKELSSNFSWIYTNKPDGAREVLSTIAGSMITVAGVVFSITIVALTLASSQFGPRMLGNFMRDTGNQVVLGTFIATFFYCLLILRTIRSGEESRFVPHLSVAIGVLLAICSLGVLIYFIHHVADSIQASTIISRVDKDFSKAVERLFPQKVGEGAAPETEDLEAKLESRSSAPVFRKDAGYVQAIDQDTLMKIGTEHDLVIKLLVHPGEYVVVEQPMAEVYHNQSCHPGVLKEIARCFFLGKERTLEQDVLFPVNQLVEIALRALSPSVNDPFTAMACLNRLTNGLCELAGRNYPLPYRKDEQGELRIMAQPVTFPLALQTSLNQFRLFAAPNPYLMQYVLQCQGKIAHKIMREEDREALMQDSKLSLSMALRETDIPETKQLLEQEFNRVECLLLRLKL